MSNLFVCWILRQGINYIASKSFVHFLRSWYTCSCSFSLKWRPRISNISCFISVIKSFLDLWLDNCISCDYAMNQLSTEARYIVDFDSLFLSPPNKVSEGTMKRAPYVCVCVRPSVQAQNVKVCFFSVISWPILILFDLSDRAWCGLQNFYTEF